MDELFYEIYNDLPRQGPGNAQCTRRAYDSLPDPSAVRRILDIGCGAGMQTLDLARFSSAEIVAVDNNPVVIDVLARRVQREGLSSRVRPLVADMFGLDASLERFDLVWSEGAIYIIGLDRGLKQWRRLIKPSGCLAFTELSWLVPNPPAEAAAFWAREYPAMNSIEGNLDIIAASGYRLRNHFTLPEAAWWVDFYDPLEQTLEKMRVKYASAEGAIALLDANQAEIDLYRRHSHSYGYVFLCHSGAALKEDGFMLKTRITEFFGIERPIVQGGLMWVATAELVSAVSNAGGMGFMTALTFPEPERFRAEIRKCRTMTDKPFGVNLTFLPTLRPPDYPAMIDVCIQEGIRFIETAGRNPEPYMSQIKSGGIRVIHKCTSVRHALKAEKIGCNAISIDGFEAAGHPGEDDVTTLILVPLVRDAVKVPIIASGGFADGRGLVAALALGADGMNMGTRFVATREAPVHENLKMALVRRSETDTRLIMRSLRNTERVLHNQAADKVLEIEGRGNTQIQDLIPYVSGLVGKEMMEDGDMEKGTMAAGQCIGLIRDIPTCRELLDRIMAEAEAIIKTRFGRMLTNE